MMQRSEYVTRCVLRDMMGGEDMRIEEVPLSLVALPNVVRQRTKRKKK